MSGSVLSEILTAIQRLAFNADVYKLRHAAAKLFYDHEAALEQKYGRSRRAKDVNVLEKSVSEMLSYDF